MTVPSSLVQGLAARLAGVTSPLGGTSQARSQPGPAPTRPQAFADLLRQQLAGGSSNPVKGGLAGIAPARLPGGGYGQPWQQPRAAGWPAFPAATAPLSGLVAQVARMVGPSESVLQLLAALLAGQAARPQSTMPAIAWARGHLGRRDWDWWCQRFVEEAYGTRDVYPTAAAAARDLVVNRDPLGWRTAPPGALLFFQADATNRHQGHVGIATGNGHMISATSRGVVEETVDQLYWRERYVGWGLPQFAGADGGRPLSPGLAG